MWLGERDRRSKRISERQLDAVDHVVDRLGCVMDAVLQRVERVVLGILDGVTGIVEEVVDTTGDVLQRVLDLAVLAGGGVTSGVHGTGEASFDGLEVGLGRVDGAVRGLGERALDAGEV